MFNKLIVLFVVLFSDYAFSAQNYSERAEGAVRESLANKELESNCSALSMTARSDVSKRPVAIASCDNEFSVPDGLKFSDMNTFNHNGDSYVCGIVSGKTELSRIGARFIFRNSDKHLTFKYSKYPLLYSANDQSGRTAVVIQTNQYRIEHEQFCK